MEKRTIDPWAWGPYTNSVQAVEIRQPEAILYCSGQAAILADGRPSDADMRTQLLQTIQHLEELLTTSGYDCSSIARLNVYMTSQEEFFATCMDVYVPWLQRHGIRQAATMIEVKGLYGTLSIELEATAVK